ncbi:hypothetical protein C5167_020966 [Papaver somniferum]|uniref:Uncharacterized protein n=1 Tax=Papaver somniferum TaxID=3469 RepID=A0A4Y7IYG1_PAPSO|nr:hypothetical protein C5167_020966 [Papaver somniferum]
MLSMSSSALPIKRVIDFLFYEFIHEFCVIGVSVENVLKIVYQTLASFRIRLVNRCFATIAGHVGKVTTAGFIPDGRQLASGSGDITDFFLGCPFIGGHKFFGISLMVGSLWLYMQGWFSKAGGLAKMRLACLP